jgi:hypothetical protein
MSWVITSDNRKKHQRAINRVLRRINKSIENDELWHGRFVVRQITSRFEHFEDKSGSVLWVLIRFVDKKTGIVMDMVESSIGLTMWNGSRVWLNDSPRDDKTDYRQVKFDKFLNLEYNYYSRFK